MPCGIYEKNGRFAKCLKATDNSPGSFIWNRVFQLLGANIRNCSKNIHKSGFKHLWTKGKSLTENEASGSSAPCGYTASNTCIIVWTIFRNNLMGWRKTQE